MSSDGAAVRVEGVGKEYKLGMIEPYKALRDVLTSAGAAPVRAAARLLHTLEGDRTARAPRRPKIWALKDVSFEVGRGEVVGLIGANGAGKSTMLKLLARITAPSAGTITLHGRVGSLLEVGTGFHPELTGRENVFLNGSILGMRRGEIQRRFDEIVEFSGVEKFLDTPVKRYSSGMQVRLAFAVAAHLQPEILLIDEVLAVGDAEFQRKCLGKMEEVTKQGRTVIFVSHQMAAVRSLCPRSLVLERGALVFDGPTEDALHYYLSQSAGGRAQVEREQLARLLVSDKLYSSDRVLRCDAVSVVDELGTPRASFRSDEDISVVVDYECLQAVRGLSVVVDLVDRSGATVLRSESVDDPSVTPDRDRGAYRSTCVLPAGLFGEAHLVVNVRLSVSLLHTLGYANVLEFDVAFQGLNGNLRAEAILRPTLAWQTEALDTASMTR
jgi:homopolymeric O-antigen transport system ATP-binding protein